MKKYDGKKRYDMLGKILKILRIIKKRDYRDIDPEEIFLDSQNLPNFNTFQFEGRLEKSISSKVFIVFTSVLFIVFFIFLTRFWYLQILNGEQFRERSENNKLKRIPIIASRGIIFSREGEKLVWNQKENINDDFSRRRYISSPGFSNLLGFVKYPSKDSAGFYYEEDYSPKDGAELYLNEIISGKNGLKLIETSVSGEIISENVVSQPKNGEDVILSIDSRIQTEMYRQISKLSNQVGFRGGAGIIIDIHSGEILAMTSYPEYDSGIMTEGKESSIIESYYKNPNNPFLNRIISGLYTPGSIVKPFLAFAALEEKIITPEKIIVSEGKLVIPNPYNPDQPTIFKDWKAHGPVDMRKAIAVSSDVYFYQIGGGFGNQKGLGIEKIKKYLEKFGFTKKTGFDSLKEVGGVIPDPQWKEQNFDGEIWRVGDTYNASIGQYGMQITPIQAVIATASLASDGYVVSPSILFTSTSTFANYKKIEGKQENFKIAKEGMRMAVTSGTASGLNVPYVEIAAKTGTAELGVRKQFVNSWVIGFFPYDNPKYAFTVVMERGPVSNLVGATFVMRQVLDWMNQNTPEYFETNI